MARYISLDAEKYIKIRESAISLFYELGIENTTIQQIAENAGIAKGTIYLYFKSRKELEKYVFDYCFDLHLKASIKDLDNEISFCGKLKKRVKNILMWSAEFPKESSLIRLYYMPVNYAGTESVAFSKSYEINRTFIEEGVKNGEFKDLPIEFSCKMFFSAVEGITTYVRSNMDVLNNKILLEQLLEAVVGGIKKY